MYNFFSQFAMIGNYNFINQILGKCKTSGRLDWPVATWRHHCQVGDLTNGAPPDGSRLLLQVLWPLHVTCVVHFDMA